MNLKEECIGGFLNGETWESLKPEERNRILFFSLLSIDERLRKVERQTGWITVITSIPWALLAVLVYNLH